MTMPLETHLPCSCKDYTETFHEGEIECPSRGAMSAQCAECHQCKFCRLVVENEVVYGSEVFWQFQPSILNNATAKDRGHNLMARALSAFVMRCHITAVSKGFWAEDDNLVVGEFPPKDKKRHFAESMMWAVRELSEAFDTWQKNGYEANDELGEELADAIIIIMDAAEGRGIGPCVGNDGENGNEPHSTGQARWQKDFLMKYSDTEKSEMIVCNVEFSRYTIGGFAKA